MDSMQRISKPKKKLLKSVGSRGTAGGSKIKGLKKIDLFSSESLKKKALAKKKKVNQIKPGSASNIKKITKTKIIRTDGKKIKMRPMKKIIIRPKPLPRHVSIVTKSPYTIDNLPTRHANKRSKTINQNFQKSKVALEINAAPKLRINKFPHGIIPRARGGGPSVHRIVSKVPSSTRKTSTTNTAKKTKGRKLPRKSMKTINASGIKLVKTTPAKLKTSRMTSFLPGQKLGIGAGINGPTYWPTMKGVVKKVPRWR